MILLPHSVSVDASSTRLFTGHSDGSIHSYDVNSGQRLHTILSASAGGAGSSNTTSQQSSTTAHITCLQTHAASGYLLSLSREGAVTLFETRGGRVIHVSFDFFVLIL